MVVLDGEKSLGGGSGVFFFFFFLGGDGSM